jgi:hypothetical protein
MVLPNRVGSGAKREAGAPSGKAGAAPATVSRELASSYATGASRCREGRRKRRPASQETCPDDLIEPRAGCPGGALACKRLCAASRRPASVAVPAHNATGIRMPATSTFHTNGTVPVPDMLSDPTRPATEPGYRVIRRNGGVTPFDASKITVALTKAFLAVEGSTAAGSRRVHDVVVELTEEVVSALTRRVGEGRLFHIEDVQDQVELALMRSEHHKVARAYVLYRDERARARGREGRCRSPGCSCPAGEGRGRHARAARRGASGAHRGRSLRRARRAFRPRRSRRGAAQPL